MDGAGVGDPLTRPEAWPCVADRVTTLETHISKLYFVGERVYKLKKPVRLPFLDASDLDRRRYFCEEELRLNRRLAPNVYLRVVPIRRDARGRVAADGEGATIDWAVEMQRLPERGMLSDVLERGEVDNQLVRRIAERLARFHEGSAHGLEVAAFGSASAIERNARENLEALREHVRPRGLAVLSEELWSFLDARTEAALRELRPQFERRAAQGRVRDGHGDLHAGNICVLPEGIVAYDCIEFSARFRCADVACDLAFLAMDLDLRGYRGFSGVLAREYATLSGDGELANVLPFYKSYRALVRAKVATIRALQVEELGPRAELCSEAQRYLHLAASWELPAALILTCGLPASGKSWIARHVARPFEAVQLSSDVRRKLLAQIPLHEHRHERYDAGLYAPEIKNRTYATLVEDARRALGHGRSVVIDAMFPSPERRAPFRDLARELECPLVVVHARAEEDLVQARMQARSHDADETSDADWGVYVQAKSSFREPDEFSPDQVVEHASGRSSPEDTSGAVIDCIVRQTRS